LKATPHLDLDVWEVVVASQSEARRSEAKRSDVLDGTSLQDPAQHVFLARCPLTSDLRRAMMGDVSETFVPCESGVAEYHQSCTSMLRRLGVSCSVVTKERLVVNTS
jgi:hypothetical protein